MAKESGMYYNQSMKLLQKKRSKIIYFLLLLAAFLLGGCSSHKEYVSASTTIRDNTPVCLVPAADGITVYGNDLASLDASHTEDGYVMAAWYGEDKPVKLQITGPDYMTYTYDLPSDGYTTFPLSAGDGAYQVGIYENVEGSQYATVFSTDLTVTITNKMGPYLYPNQYVAFTKDSQIVREAQTLVAGAHDDLEAIICIYKSTGAKVSGPVPMPTKVEKITILRAVHKYKDSREQFEQRTHKRLIDVLTPSQKTIDALQKLDVSAGVYVNVKMK